MLTIAWDVDDVLNNLMQEWLKDYCISNGQKVAYADIIQNPPHKILGISLNEYEKSLDKFRLSENALKLKPDEQILSWFEKNGGEFKNIALSSTSQHTSQNGAYWVMKHFSKWINSYNIVPSLRPDENFSRQYNTKKEFLQWIKTVDILIDDSEKNIEDAKSIGIKGLLVARPWNSGGYTIPEILKKLDDLKGAAVESF